jgi:thioredoxin 1
MSSNTVTIDDSNFNEVVMASDTPILVDFWAEWCGPCKIISPILDEIAAENEQKIVIGKLNVDSAIQTAQRFEVLSIPTLILFKDGEPQVRIVGAQPKSSLMDKISPYL